MKDRSALTIALGVALGVLGLILTRCEADCCYEHAEPGCSDPRAQQAACSIDPHCCDVSWDASCAELACGG